MLYSSSEGAVGEFADLEITADRFIVEGSFYQKEMVLSRHPP